MSVIAESDVSKTEQDVIFKTKASRRPLVLYRRGDKSFAKFRLDSQNRSISIAKRHALNEELAALDKAWLQQWLTDPTDEFGALVQDFVKDLEAITSRPVDYD